MPPPSLPQPIIVPPVANGRYPHFINHDALIWDRFLRTQSLTQFRVAYDVHVGSISPAAADLDENYARMVAALSSKRIDVVMYFPSETMILEVKQYAGLAAIGQAVSYAFLFKRRFPEKPKVTAAILTDTAQPDMHTLCVTFNVLLLEIDHLEHK